MLIFQLVRFIWGLGQVQSHFPDLDCDPVLNAVSEKCQVYLTTLTRSTGLTFLGCFGTSRKLALGDNRLPVCGLLGYWVLFYYSRKWEYVKGEIFSLFVIHCGGRMQHYALGAWGLLPSSESRGAHSHHALARGNPRPPQPLPESLRSANFQWKLAQSHLKFIWPSR